MRALPSLPAAAAAALLLALAPRTPAGAELDGAQAFRSACGPCHSNNLGHRIGPSLVGIEGRLSGTAPGFDYSEVMKKAAIRWDAATLDRFLAAPASVVAGSRMSYPGLKDEARRRAIVDYIVGLRVDAPARGRLAVISAAPSVTSHEK